MYNLAPSYKSDFCTLQYIREKISCKDFHGANGNSLIHLCRNFGCFLGIEQENLHILELFAVYHDLGKIVIPDEIIFKVNALTKEEWDEIKAHPIIGSRLAESFPDISHISHLILTHHERWDGTGYPCGLVGENIPFLSRVLSIADAFDAMTSNRPYALHDGLSREEALFRIAKAAGTQFDPNLAGMFVSEKFWRIYDRAAVGDVSQNR